MTATRSYARQGEQLHRSGDTEGSLALLTEGVRLFPDDVTGRLVLARVYRESGREHQARDWLESVLQTDAECPAARLQLAEILGGVEAEEHYGRLRAQEPWDAAYVLPEFSSPVPTAIPAMDFEFDDEESEPEIGLDSLPHVATVTLAEIYLQQGLTEQAAQIFRQLLEREPGDATVKRRLAEIESSISEARPETGGAAGGAK